MKYTSKHGQAFARLKVPFPRLCLSFSSFLLATAPLLGVDYFWDANGNTAGVGGTGNWATANTWRNGSTTGVLGNWEDGNTAVFGTTAGTTTVGANVSVTGVTLSTANHSIIGGGRLDFGAGGTLNLPTIGGKITAPLAGTVTITPTTGNLGTGTSAFFKANSTGLVSTTLSGNDPNRNVILDHVGAFGPAGSSVTISNAVLGLGALTTEAIGQAAANGSGGGLSFSAWNLSLAGAIRSRAGANTINSATTLTANSTLLNRGVAGVKLIFSATSTIDLGANTLLLSPIAASEGIELNGSISGTGGITQGDTTLTSAGVVGATSVSTLAGTCTYTGPTVVNKGILSLKGSLTSNISLANGTGISGEGSTTGSVTFTGSTTLTFNPATTAALTAGSVDASAAVVTLSLSGVGAGGTGIVILDAPGGITGEVGPNFSYSGSGTVYLNAEKTKLLFDYVPRTITWQGADVTNPAFWDLNTTTNWLFTAAPDKFLASDTVIFDDTATSFTVTAQGTNVVPGNMRINNDQAGHEYLFNGAPIAGNGGVTKEGSQKAIFATNNTYAGITTITAGTLQLGDGTAATGSTGPGEIVDNGALIVNSGANNRTLLNAVSGTGTLEYSGTGVFNVASNVTITGNTIISSGNLQIGNGSFTGNVSGNIVNNGTLSFNRTDAISFPNTISGTGSISKTLGGTVTLSGSNTFGGNVLVSGANQVLIITSNTALGSTAGTTTITAGARLELANGLVVTGETAEITSSSSNFNGALQAQAGAMVTWDGPIRLNSLDARVGGGVGSTFIISGAIQDGTTTALNIGTGTGGTGTVILATPAGGNTYTGGTNLIRGTVKLGANNTLPATTILDVDASTAAEASTVDLHGFHQIIAGLQRGNSTGGAAILTNSAATASTLTVSQATNTTYSGSITGKINLVKDGVGTLNTTGAISYTGDTTIKAGTLGFAQMGLADTSTVTIDAGGVMGLNFTGTDKILSLVINGVSLPVGIYSSTSHGGIYASILTGSGSLQVGELGFASWIADFPTLTGNDALPAADADGDGMTNLLEFVLGGNPTANDLSILPTISSLTGQTTVLNFKRTDLSQGDTTLILQIGTDLATWPASTEITIGAVSDATGTLPGGVSYSVQENADLPDEVIILIPNGTDLRKFLRLKATKP